MTSQRSQGAALWRRGGDRPGAGSRLCRLRATSSRSGTRGSYAQESPDQLTRDQTHPPPRHRRSAPSCRLADAGLGRRARPRHPRRRRRRDHRRPARRHRPARDHRRSRPLHVEGRPGPLRAHDDPVHQRHNRTRARRGASPLCTLPGGHVPAGHMQVRTGPAPSRASIGAPGWTTAQPPAPRQVRG